MDAGKLGPKPVPRVALTPGLKGPVETPAIPPGSSLPPKNDYGAVHSAPQVGLGSAGGVLKLQGFGLQAPQEFGELPLELRTQVATEVAQRRRRHVEADDNARFAGWRADYGSHLIEAPLIVGPAGTTLGSSPLEALGELTGKVNLGVFRRAHPDGNRIVKLLPQTGFPDFLLGNLLAEQVGGPKIHRFGRVEVKGGSGRLENYRVAMFLEMEELHPGAAAGRLKEILKEVKNGAAPRLPLEQLAAGFAALIIKSLIANVAPADPDLLFDAKGLGRPLDGDAYHRVFDPEETVSLMRRAINEHGWDDFREPVRAALHQALAEAPLDERKRRHLADALQVF